MIQHLQTQLEAANETNGVQVWLTPGVDWVQPLATFLGEQPVSDVSELRNDAIVVVPIVKGDSVPKLDLKRVVSVLEGQWFQKKSIRYLDFLRG